MSPSTLNKLYFFIAAKTRRLKLLYNNLLFTKVAAPVPAPMGLLRKENLLRITHLVILLGVADVDFVSLEDAWRVG